jgi:hypothetical protein
VKWTLKFESTNSHDSSLVKKGIGQIIKVCNHFKSEYYIISVG